MDAEHIEASAYVSFLLGMWFHTRELVGKPSVDEARTALQGIPRHLRGLDGNADRS
jgi:hypothetical protein